ncbi:MAG: molybdenum cofactor biosynthesis protein B [Thalassolituus sp.]
MSKMFTEKFRSLNISVLTVSDTRTEENDTSGQYLVDSITSSGHKNSDKKIVIDNIYKIREIVSHWIADDRTQVIIVTGGTGFTERDSTPEAIAPLFDKTINGFGELFRQLSYETIGTSTIQSRAIAGLANDTLIFCVPGSTNACRQAWEQIICQQLDSRHKPCNFAMRLKKVSDGAGN